MRIITKRSWIVILFVFCASLISTNVKAKNIMNNLPKKAIIIIAHGAPSPAWGAKVTVLESEVKEKLKAVMPDNKYLVKVAFMEFNKPTISDIISGFEKEGVTDVLAVPLFISPSGHSLEDIPNILGLAYNPKKRKDLIEEGTDLVSTRIKIQISPLLNYGDLIPNIILDRVKNNIDENQKEALMLVAHGSPEYAPHWEEMLERVEDKVKDNTSIDKYDFAFVEMGQHFKENALPKIEKLQKNGYKVILQGIYLSSGADIILRIGGNAKMLQDDNIVVGKEGLLPDSRVSSWIVDRITDWK